MPGNGVGTAIPTEGKTDSGSVSTTRAVAKPGKCRKMRRDPENAATDDDRLRIGEKKQD